MDDALQAEAYAAADFSSGDHSVLQEVEALLGASGRGDGSGLDVVDLGCGPGNISFLLARRWPAARVLGIDGSAAMLTIAERRRRREPAGLEQLRFRRVVLPDRSLAGPFDVIVSNSLLHHLHDPAVFWASVAQLARQASWVYVRDLRRPSSLLELAGLVERHAAAAAPVLRRDFAASLNAAFTPAEVRQQLRQGALQGLEVRQREDRYLEIQGRWP